jgi:hypothetical protein
MRFSSSRARGLGALVVAVAMTVFGCSRQPARPDISGTWGHQTVFGLDFVCGEALAGGSVRTTECRQPDGAPSPEEQAPDFPKYKPEFLARVTDLRDRQIKTDTVLRCYPPGVPRIGPPAKIVQTATEVVFLYDDPNGSFYRVIPIDGRPRRAGVSASYLGDAVGRYEGDALIVETSNFTDETWLTDNGAFHTAGLRVVERLRRVGETIVYQATAHDPEVLAEPWTMTPRVLTPSAQQLEEPPRCEERDLEDMVDESQFHENPR